MAGLSSRRRRSKPEISTRSMELCEILNQPLYEDENEDEQDTNFLAMLQAQFSGYGFLEHPVHKYVQTDPDVSTVPSMWLFRARDSAEALCTGITNYINFLYHSTPIEGLSKKEVISKVGKDGRSDDSFGGGKLILNFPSADASLERRYMQQKMKYLLRLALLLRNSIPLPQKYPDDKMSSTEACLALCDVSEKADKAVQTEELDDSIDTLKSGKEIATASTQTDTIDGRPLFNSSTAAVGKSAKNTKSTQSTGVTKERTSAKAPEKPPRKPISSISTFSNALDKLQTGTHSTCPLDKPGPVLATKKTCLGKTPERNQRDAAMHAGQNSRLAANRSSFISRARHVAPGKNATNTESSEACSSKFASSTNPLNRPKNIFRLNLVTSGTSGTNSEVAGESSSKSTSCNNPSKPDEKKSSIKPTLRRKKIVGEKSGYRLPVKSSSQPIIKKC